MKKYTLSGGLHGVAEELLRPQDRKNGTGQSADPVFYVYVEAVSCPLSPHHRITGMIAFSLHLCYSIKYHTVPVMGSKYRRHTS